MILAEHLAKMFGAFHAVRDISLEVEAGEVLALLGPNGAGKTTTVRMLAAILRPSTGRAIVGGLDVAEHPRQVRAMVGLLTEFPGLYNRMRALDYLTFFGKLQGLSDERCRARGEELLRRFDLWEARDKRLDAFSKGMKQKIALIRALIHDPPILYLDEPTTAMDPHSARTVRDAIAELRAQRRTILLTTHNLVEAEDLADRIAVVRAGTIIAQGTRAELSYQLMGAPIWELRLARPAPDLARYLDGLGEIVEQGDDWLHYRCSDPAAVNPTLVGRLTQAGLPLLALAEVPRSLEDVYLHLMEDEPPTAKPALLIPETTLA